MLSVLSDPGSLMDDWRFEFMHTVTRSTIPVRLFLEQIVTHVFVFANSKVLTSVRYMSFVHMDGQFQFVQGRGVTCR